MPWGLPANAGRWNGGDWRTDISTYLSARSAQGFTCIRVHIFGTTKTGCARRQRQHARRHQPVQYHQRPHLGVQPAYWQRIDFLLDEAAAVGITVEMTAAFRWDFDTSIFANTWTTTQCTNFGTALGARYRTRPNVLWFFGDDYNGQYDTQFNAIIAAIRAAGDTHKATIEYAATGTTSRRDLSGNPSDTAFAWGGANADYNLGYYYEPTYFAIEFAYQESPAIPVIWGDGFYFGDAASAPTDNRLDRNFAWWALSSGARGVSTGSDAVWQWPSTAMAAVLTEGWFTTVAAKARALVESLPGWYNLLPDTSSVLVTAGRGTRAAYSSQFYLACYRHLRVGVAVPGWLAGADLHVGVQLDHDRPDEDGRRVHRDLGGPGERRADGHGHGQHLLVVGAGQQLRWRHRLAADPAGARHGQHRHCGRGRGQRQGECPAGGGHRQCRRSREFGGGERGHGQHVQQHERPRGRGRRVGGRPGGSGV